MIAMRAPSMWGKSAVVASKTNDQSVPARRIASRSSHQAKRGARGFAHGLRLRTRDIDARPALGVAAGSALGFELQQMGEEGALREGVELQ